MRTPLYCLVSLCFTSSLFADEVPEQTNTQPPGLVAPSTYTEQPFSATDSATQSYPMGNMDTMPIQSTGTYNNQHPESHPIPLDEIPDS